MSMFEGIGHRVAVVLCSISVLAWVATFQLMMGEMAVSEGAIQALLMSSMTGFFQSLDPSVLSLFLIIWVVGMIAMMFPAMIPVVSIYEKSNRTTAGAFGLSLFLGGYLAMYALLGLGLYLVIFAGFQVASLVTWLSEYSLQISGVVLIAAGIWQITPLKETCLRHCSSPLGFFLRHNKPGLLGAGTMGATHGAYCVGCCWTYMLVMAAVAAMSIPAMILLAVVITLEKAVFVGTKWFTWLVAAGFTVLGLLLSLLPSIA